MPLLLLKVIRCQDRIGNIIERIACNIYKIKPPLHVRRHPSGIACKFLTYILFERRTLPPAHFLYLSIRVASQRQRQRQRQLAPLLRNECVFIQVIRIPLFVG